MNRARRRRIATAERKVRQRWVRRLLGFHRQTAGVFGGEIVWRGKAPAPAAVAMEAAWTRKAVQRPASVLCMPCETGLLSMTPPPAVFVARGMTMPIRDGVVFGICTTCAPREDDSLLSKAYELSLQLWPELRRLPTENIHREAGWA
jgi:hypothetical protein